MLHCCFLLCVHAQSCPTLCAPMDCSLPDSSVYGDSPGKNTGVGCHFLLQGIFPTSGSNLCLLHCRQILYHWATGEVPFYSLIFSYFLQDLFTISMICKVSPSMCYLPSLLHWWNLHEGRGSISCWEHFLAQSSQQLNKCLLMDATDYIHLLQHSKLALLHPCSYESPFSSDTLNRSHLCS